MIRSRTVSLLTAALLIAPQGAFANPLGANVVGGQATVQGQGSALVTVTQSSQNAIINWNTFNLGAGDLTKFVQPNSSAIALNRVTGGLGASQIYGTISANGRVFLINPYGILFGAGSQINTAGFLASTNDIKNRDFMHGHYNFNKPGHPDASIVNLGNIHITPSSTGFAALVAPGVRNAGTITANLGHVALASGNGFTLDFYGDKLITLKVGDQVAAKVVDVATGQPLDALVKNEGRLRANGGQVELTAAAARHVVDAVINNTGTIEANTVGTKNGMIVLGAATAGTKPAGAPVQKVKIAGKLSVSGHKAGQTGGTVVVTGEDIALTGAKINASGQAGGGTVLIGGDTGGGHVNSAVAGFAQAKLQPWPVATATTVSVDAASVIDASAKTTGNGGKVVVWSDQTTNFAGLIKARGGALSGNGGFVEVSSHGVLRFNGLVDLRAPFGTSGTLLLDPQNVTICSNCTDTEEGNQATLNGGVFAPGGNNSTLEVQTLQNQLGLSDVVVTTGTAGTQSGDITVIAPVGWSTANTLTLNAAHDININSSITATKGGLTLDAGHNISAIAGVNVGTFTLQKGSWSQVSSELPTFSAQDFRLSGGTFLRARGGEGFDDSPYKIADIYGLQGIGTVAPSRQNFELARSIDASGTVNWNSGAGFAPIGQFSGTLDGNGHKISGLTIAPTDPNVSDIGLFGINFGTVRNLTLSDVTVFANPNSTALGQHIGTVAGQNLGMISNVSVGASSDGPGSQIIGGSFSSVSAGGLAGQNFTMPGDDPTRHGVIKKSSADVAVTIGDGVSCPTNNCGGGWNYAGGLVGFNAGTIAGSSATGNVISGSNSFAGGLVGASQVNSSNQTVKPRIINSFATGNVTSDGTNVALGGLVGYNGAFNGFDGHNGATIKNSYAWGDVTSSGANATLGGLVGANDTFGRIKDSHATGNVTSTANLPSANCSTGDCQSVIAGGLVGQNEGKIKSTFSFDGASSESFGLGLTYATGDVSVGQNATAGGLVGFNDGIIRRSVAIGNVTGGSGSGNNEHDRTTTLGGLVGENQGVISGSFAAGTVGSVDAQFITAGGFVGENGGTIKNSAAFGDVVAGANSVAGGFVGDNTTNNGGCDGCMHGIGFNQNATIKNALAFGAVTVGSSGLAGGFAGSGNGRLSFTGAFGPVTGGDNSVLGGLVGALSLKKNDAGTFAGSIDNSVAFGPVTSTGPNSIIGGLVGINGGDISLSAFGLLGGPASGPGNNVSDSFVSSQFASFASGPLPGQVAGTSDSFIGGFVGINIGTIRDGVVGDGTSVTGTGGNNFVGGIAALNFGSINTSVSRATVSSGDNSVVGSAVGANATFVNFLPGQIPNSSFPSGTIDTLTTGITGTATPQVGVTNPQGGLPTFPAIIPPCGDTVCFVLNNGRLTDAPVPLPPILPPDLPNVPPPPLTKLVIPSTPPIQQIVPINFNTGNQQPVQINLTTGDTGGTGGAGGNGANGGNGNNAGNKPPGNPPGVPPPGRGIGRTLNEQMFSGVPPLGETRFLPEIVLQISNTISLDQVMLVAKQLGLTLIASQSFDAAGRVIYRFGTGGKDIRALILALEHKQIVASAEPNYIFGLAQGATQPAAPAQTDQTGSIPPAGEATDLANSDTASLTSLPAGDAAQYVIDKLHLGALHQRVRGRNVTVAVIDSEIDAKHPDLAGVIAERFDATSSASRPHLHGTGMAGAIASHQRLLGVAPGVRILAIKAFDESASSAEATSFQILKGLDYAISRNVRIINMSFAGPRDIMMERTLKTAYDKGIVLIAAAGNAGPKSAPLYPGADPSVIAVTATDYADKPFAMANRGNYIAVAAPGVDVMVPSPNGSYQLTTGTSVAAAHVSGIAALLLESKPTMTPSELRGILMRTAKAITHQKDDPTVAGLVDPVSALQATGPARAVETVPPAGAAIH